MSRRPGRELELLPHYIYKHYDADMRLIYVGMTSDPEGRPVAAKARPWIKTESARIVVSPAMPYEAAVWVERSLIQEVQPRHNIRCGKPTPDEQDWRVARICEVEGVTANTAQWAVQYFPEPKREFEAFLEFRRLAALST